MNSLVANMNDEQSEAVRTTEGPLFVWHRIAYLLNEKGVSYNIQQLRLPIKQLKK